MAAQATKAHMEAMNRSDTPTARYTLDIQASATSAASFSWAIRDRGKLDPIACYVSIRPGPRPGSQ
jgi:hypothetical protein